MLTCRYNQIRRKIKRFSPSAGTLLCLYALFSSELPSEAFFEEKQEINRVERKSPHKASPFTTINTDKPSRKGRPECGLPLSSYVTALSSRFCKNAPSFSYYSLYPPAASHRHWCVLTVICSPAISFSISSCKPSC